MGEGDDEGGGDDNGVSTGRSISARRARRARRATRPRRVVHVPRLAPLCRFRDCQHDAEPGCAVRDAVPAQRLRNYRKLQREARRDTLTALERKAQVQQ